MGTGKPLTWDSVTKGVWGAMIAGAIGGALGGFGGQFAQVLFGRMSAGLGKFAAEFAVDAVFDILGGILGDYAAGNPITWESIVMGLAIGSAVNVSMGGMGALAKNGVNAPKTDVGGGTPKVNADGTPATPRTGFKNKAQDLARKIQDFQGRMMETGQNFGSKARFGDNAFTTSGNKLALNEAQHRIQNGEAFPTRNKPVNDAEHQRGIDTESNDPHTRPEENSDPNIRKTYGEEGATAEINIKKDIPKRVQQMIAKIDKSGSIRVDSIHPDDLVLLSKWYGKEIGVVQSVYHKNLRVVLGTDNRVSMRPGETFVVHTHPVYVSKGDHFVRYDLPTAGPHVEGVVDWSGRIIYFKEQIPLPSGEMGGGVLNPKNRYGMLEDMPKTFKAAFMDDNGNIVGYARLEVRTELKTVVVNGVKQQQWVQKVKVIER
jgi:hypothetical protein